MHLPTFTNVQITVHIVYFIFMYIRRLETSLHSCSLILDYVAIIKQQVEAEH